MGGLLGLAGTVLNILSMIDQTKKQRAYDAEMEKPLSRFFSPEMGEQTEYASDAYNAYGPEAPQFGERKFTAPTGRYNFDFDKFVSQGKSRDLPLLQQMLAMEEAIGNRRFGERPVRDFLTEEKKPVEMTDFEGGRIDTMEVPTGKYNFDVNKITPGMKVKDLPYLSAIRAAISPPAKFRSFDPTHDIYSESGDLLRPGRAKATEHAYKLTKEIGGKTRTRTVYGKADLDKAVSEGWAEGELGTGGKGLQSVSEDKGDYTRKGTFDPESGKYTWEAWTKKGRAPAAEGGAEKDYESREAKIRDDALAYARAMAANEFGAITDQDFFSRTYKEKYKELISEYQRRNLLPKDWTGEPEVPPMGGNVSKEQGAAMQKDIADAADALKRGADRKAVIERFRKKWGVEPFVQ